MNRARQKRGRPSYDKTTRNPLRVFIHNRQFEIGLSNSEFMKRLGMSTVTYYKRLKRCNWNVQELYKIAELLKVSEDTVFEKIKKIK